MMEQERDQDTAIRTSDVAEAGQTHRADDRVSARTGDLEIVPDRDDRADQSTQPDEDRRQPLLDDGQLGDLRGRWESIQISFVDEPRQSVQQADQLVAEVMTVLAQTFDRERSAMEQQWDKGDDVSTEDLRVALRRYRSFFDRLLST
jgi:hypothetical protein